DLLAAGGRQNDVEGGLLLRRGTVTTCRRCARRGHRDRSGSRDVPLVLDLLLELDEIEHGHLPELVEHLVDATCCHYCSSSCGSVVSSAVFGSAVSLGGSDVSLCACSCSLRALCGPRSICRAAV